jgi:hypothetical protein
VCSPSRGAGSTGDDHRPAKAASVPIAMSHEGRMLFSGSAMLRGPVAQGKPVAGSTV